MSDHDLLIQICERVAHLEDMMMNHLHHHFIYTMALFTGLLSTVGTLIAYVWKHRKNHSKS